ncbi:Uncharacterized protein CLAVI_000227 [Candidatus Clavichlamydia salmonicola]|uniref:rod shape-determining protein MreC n=1 Tax=Candidatus Clavichlamydia salmonicola TaxID=469812 RepID=UPI001891E364|nr:rod shape-determining protein MreC [Candidatus Clavichlamydia salmonicola]MBF5050614.1 Uncharacterized protein [Candidatus Clavichlamydia salmonicola]
MTSYRKKNTPSTSKLFQYIFCFILITIPLTIPLAFSKKAQRAVLFSLFFFHPSKKPLDQSIEKEKTEKYLLTLEVKRLHNIIDQIYDSLIWVNEISLKTSFKEQIKNSLLIPLITLPAQIIYRDPAGWGSSCWINVGKQTNAKTGYCVIEKNSPVVIGNILVGLIDFVGERQSRVRFVTDADIHPAVKVDSGISKNFETIKHIESILIYLKTNIDKREDLHHSLNLIEYLAKLKNELQGEIKTLNITLQGTISGAGNPIKKRGSTVLKGNAFCFSSSLEKGPLLIDEKFLPSIQPLDMLITTGTDGIFPPGLSVGKITKIIPPKAGSCNYDLEAISEIPNFNQLSQVFIIPPCAFDKNDTPNIFRFFQND